MEKNTFEIISERYPQILLPIACGEKNTPEFKDAVLRGLPVENRQEDFFSKYDKLENISTSAGNIDILSVRERETFVHVYRALAYRCEPVEILDSVGAGMVSGLINWEKIHRHKEEYLSSGGDKWDEEFQNFISDKKNYIDSIIIISSSNYSAVPAYEMELTESEWLEKSIAIRKYHELTHFICRNQYPGDVDAIRDEVMADAVGILAAYGKYDKKMGLRFLGIENGSLMEGGRLSHYVPEEKISEEMLHAQQIADKFDGIEINGQQDALELVPVLWNLLEH